MKYAKSAFSLVEMLVALVLVTLLIGVAIFSFKYQLMAIHKIKKVGVSAVIKYAQLRSSLESVKHYVVDDYDMLNQPMKNLHYYFKGTKKEINYITENPLFSNDIAVVRLKCEEDTLLYKEEKLYGNIDFLRPQLLEESRAMILYKNLDMCEFRYFIDKREYQEVLDIVPNAVSIKMNYKENTQEMYINIHSDNNRSKYYVYDAVYPNE